MIKRETFKIDGWKLLILPNKEVRAQRIAPTTAEEIFGDSRAIDASVPGNFELDMMTAGLLPDLYYADNVLLAQKLENMHLWYAAEFDHRKRDGCDAFLRFEGIDTAAEILLDGVKAGESEDMFLPFVLPLNDTAEGRHSVVVHITPAMIHVRKKHLAASAYSHDFNDDSVKIRKAPYMYGWDIMPRIVSAGLWKPVNIEYKPKDRIENVFIYTRDLTESKANMRIKTEIDIDDDFISDYSYRVEGSCGDSYFCFERPLMSVDALDGFEILSPRLWFPKNYGEPSLYDVKVTLLRQNEARDEIELKIGIRIIELERSSLAGKDGRFVIRVNGKRIFAMGSNLVPTDAFPSRMKDYTARQNEMLADLGCNIVRCWGGNVYPDDDLFDFCDEHGILVWQDFSMACGRYPEDSETVFLLEQEVRHVVRSLRNHPSLAIWAGDNECDGKEHRQTICGREVNAVDTNLHSLTRGVIPFVLRNEDFTRPYLPSSPFVDSTAFRAGGDTRSAEQHLWGPRDFFKGDFYVNSTAHFASETGYHGCPSPESIKKFISPDALDKMGDGQKSDDPEWMLHSSTFRTDSYAPYNYRNSLMIRQVERLFGSASKELEVFALQSQISQAEAKKFFIEHFRCDKWRRSGIIWWNLIDGWPQISDAVVDWYGVKKLAYRYIKASQQPVCLMFDEPVGGKIKLKAANDLQTEMTVSYTVTDMSSDETVISGSATLPANSCEELESVIERSGSLYLIEWDGDVRGRNHYTADIYHGLDFERYVFLAKKAGLTEN